MENTRKENRRESGAGRIRALEKRAGVVHNVAVAVRQACIIMDGGRPAGTKEKGFLQVARDDWKYYDDDEEMGEGEEERKALPPEMQCGNCLHWVERDTVCCPWCAKVFDEKKRGRP